MGFKKYVVVKSETEAQDLIREGADLFGSIRQLTLKLPFSHSHIYRWAAGESRMKAQDYDKIRAFIDIERNRMDKLWSRKK